MIGLEKIVDRIETDGRLECDRILTEARGQAERVEREYAHQAQRLRTEAERTLSAELARAKKSRRDLMTMERRRAVLEAKQGLVEETFLGARQALCGLNDERREKLFCALASAAKLEGRRGELILSAADHAAVGKAVAEKVPGLQLSAQTRPIEGLILRYGTLEVDCTFDTILEQMRRRLSAQIAALLFGGEEQEGERSGG